MRRRHGGTGLHSLSTCGNDATARCRELFPRCASCGNVGPVQAVALRLKINPNLDFDVSPSTQSNMWGAPKRRPSVKQFVFITHTANPHRPIYPFRSFLPFYLPASPLPVPRRHIILTAAMVYPSPRSTRQRQPKPDISAVLRYYSLQHPNTEPSPHHVQTPRKI